MMCICLLIFPNIGLTFVTDYMIFVVLRCVSGFAVGGLLGTGFVLGKLLRIMYGQFSNFDFIFIISCSKLLYENCHVQYLNIFVGESIRSKNSQNTYSRILNFGTSFLFVRVLLKIFFFIAISTRTYFVCEKAKLRIIRLDHVSREFEYIDMWMTKYAKPSNHHFCR